MRRGWSFRTQLTVRWTLAFGLLLALANVGIYLASRYYAYRDFDTQLRTVAGIELASAIDEGRGIHLHPLPPDMAAGEATARFAQVYDEAGRLILETPEMTDMTRPLVSAAILARALGGTAEVFDLAVEGRPGRAIALRAAADQGRYVLVVGLYRDQLTRLLSRLSWMLGLVWACGMGVSGVIAAMLATRTLEPISRITTRAARIARGGGDIHARLDAPSADDEIGRMTALLNEMLDRLHRVIAANRHFAADAAHELRGPLTSSAGEIDVALKRPRTPEEYRETLTTVRERLTEMTMLTQDLMLLARAEESPAGPVLQEVPVAPLVEECRRRVLPAAAARGVRVTVDLPVDACVYGEAGLLARVIDNLLANAVQHSELDGVVSVDARFDRAPGDTWETGFLRLRVSDSGAGIPAPEWERIFERFYRRDSSRSRRSGGTGLGLPLSRAIARLHGGTVRVVESSSAGTMFELRLPGRAGRDAAGTPT